jgi:hypothetical protein
MSEENKGKRDEIIKKAKTDLIWEMIMENQDADDATFTKADIEVELYGWLEKVDPTAKKPQEERPSVELREILIHLIDYREILKNRPNNLTKLIQKLQNKLSVQERV